MREMGRLRGQSSRAIMPSDGAIKPRSNKVKQVELRDQMTTIKQSQILDAIFLCARDLATHSKALG